MEVVLDAKKLKRILAVAVDGVSLQPAHHFNPAERVPGEYGDGEQSDRKTDQQGPGRR
jgi:hypothetical protein